MDDHTPHALYYYYYCFVVSTGLTVGLLISAGSRTMMDVINLSSLLANTPSLFAGIVDLVHVVSLDIV